LPLATNTLTLVIGGNTYTDKLTEIANSFSAVSLTGELTGPGMTKDMSELDISYTQAFGTGRLISGSATFAVLDAAPEASTWVMMVLGFAGLGYAGFRRNAKARVMAAAI
jgi:hypothetical protein